MLTTPSPSQKKQQPAWPQLKKEEEPKLINVTGSQSKSNVVKHIKKKESDSEAEGEDYVPVPAFNRSFHDAIALAFESATSTCGSQGKRYLID